MDLKRLLFESTSADHPLHCRTRCHVGKKCYTIAYVVNRKFLTLTAVLRVPSKLSHKPVNKAPRHKRRRRRSLCPLRCPPAAMEYVTRSSQTDSESPPDLMDDATQTPTLVRTWSKHTQTDAVASCGRQQQTDPPPALRPQAVQTVSNAISLATQTEWYTVSRCLATDSIAAAPMACQTEVSAASVCTQTDGETPCPQPPMADEREAEIVLLNEIGEMLINQNSVLHNNTALLSQLTEHTVLQSVVRRQRMLRKEKSLVEDPLRPARYRVRGHRGRRPSKGSRRRPEVLHQAVQVDRRPEVLHQAVQADRWPVGRDNWCQTSERAGGGGDELKRRSSWRFFKN